MTRLAVDKRHVFGEDAERVLREQQRLYGIKAPLLLRTDRRTAFKDALDGQATRLARRVG